MDDRTLARGVQMLPLNSLGPTIGRRAPTLAKGSTMNPLIVEGVRLFAAAALAAAKGVPVNALPAAQLARMGLLRAPLVGLGPLAGAFASGAVVAALAHPQGRAWIKEQGSRAVHWVRHLRASDSEQKGPGEQATELSPQNGVYVS